MCFSEKWSLNLSILGFLLTSYRVYNNYSVTAIIVSLFYTIMELTQYFQYKVINQCDNKVNQNLTKFTWFLEWIQPLMWNLIFYNFTKLFRRKEVKKSENLHRKKQNDSIPKT